MNNSNWSFEEFHFPEDDLYWSDSPGFFNVKSSVSDKYIGFNKEWDDILDAIKSIPEYKGK